MRVDNPEAGSLPELVGAEIRAEMARQRITQTALAERLGWVQQRLSRRLTGEVPMRLDELQQIADALRAPVTQFFPSPALVRSA